MAHMALSAVLFSFLGVFVRFLPRIPALEVVIFRALVSLVMCVGWLWWKGRPLLGTHRRWLLARGFFGFLGLTAYVYTVQRLPLAEAVVIQYTNPIFTSLFAPLILQERWSGTEWKATLLAFVGVFLIADPGGRGQLWVALTGLAGAASVGVAYNIVRKVGLLGEDPMTVILYLPLVAVFAGLPIAVPSWKAPLGWEWALLLGLGFTNTLGQYFLTRGLKLVRAARATVVNYLVVALSALYSLALGERFHGKSLAGMALILFSIFLVSRPYLIAPKATQS